MAEPPSRVDRIGIARLLAPHRPVLALALLACFLYLPSVWLRDLWNPDEPRYAEVARQMASRGDYILPRLNGEAYGEKPPMFFWLGGLAGSLPGVPFESGPRLVSVLAAFGTLLATFLLGRRLADAETGWLAALVLATSAMFAVHASAGVIDATLTLLVAAAISCGLRARETASPVLWAGFYLLAGLAILTKGPVGLLVPAGVALLVALQEEGARGAWAPPASWHPAWGIAVALLVAALWVGPAIARGGPEYADTILLKQNIGRAWRSWHHREPLQYFLAVFPASFFPWIVALPGALVGAWGRRRAERGARAALTWFAFTFIFFSLVSGKKTRYLLPLFPAASLLVAIELRGLLPGARHAAPRWRSLLPVALGGAALLAAGVALAAAPLGPAERLVRRMSGLAADQEAGLLWIARLPGGLALLLPGLLLAALGAAAALFALGRRHDPRRALACVMAGWIAAAGWAQWAGVPILDVVKSGRRLAEAAQRAAGADGEVVTYRASFAGLFNFYMRRDLIPRMSGPQQTATFLREHPGAVVLARARDLEPLLARAGSLRVIHCRRIGGVEACAAQSGPLRP